MNRHITIAIDGPAGAGKSAVSKKLASELNAIYLDTGAMYRAVGIYMMRNEIDLKDAEAIAAHAHEAKVDIRYVGAERHVYLLDEDVTGMLREEAVGNAASAVGKVARVRQILVARQQEIARVQSVVMDGRDIGTKVLPDATLKIYLTASPEERARRRVRQLEQAGKTVDYDQILSEINQRDWDDTHRAESPLCQAEDAVLVDTSDMTENEAAETILSLLRERTDRA